METKRLFLREQTRELLEYVINQPVADQMVFFGTETTEQLTFELSKAKPKLKPNVIRNWIKWDLIDKQTNQVIGSCGFHNWIPEHERAEIGYLLHENYRKKGFMSEALSAVIKHGFHTMKLNRIEAFISPENMPSLNVVNTLGFTKEGILRQHYKTPEKIHDSAVFSLLKSEFKD